MKKIGLIVAVICLILAVGSALGDEYTTNSKGWASDPDSMINILDPSNAPARVIPHKGLMGLTEEGLPGDKGSAAGGRSEVRDSLVNYLDPSYTPAIAKKIATGALRFDPGSGVHEISPVE
ncbi:MAG: hypothetical protein WCD00_07610 [Desulfuromonadaceae bacterium]